MRVYRDAGVTTLRAAPEGATVAERLETLGRFMDLVQAVNAEPSPATASACGTTRETSDG